MPRVTAAVWLGAALVAATLLRLPSAWESGNALNHVSGVWMALADDLARGTFYRPLHDPALGWGGTRYFPLAFVLHAGLIRAGLPLLQAGQLLSLAAGAAAAAGAARFLWRAGHRPWVAAGLGALVLAGYSGQFALTALRGDVVAVAFSTWGLATLLPRRPGTDHRGLAAASILLALAFLAKPTALAAAGAGLAFVASREGPRRAISLALPFSACSAAGLITTEVLSEGRFSALLLGLGGGGGGLSGLLHAPPRLADLLVRSDPAGLLLLLAAAAAVPRALRAPPGPHRDAMHLTAAWLAFAAATVLATLASPGTGVNHLLELEAPAALFAASALVGTAPRLVRSVTALAAAAGVATAAVTWQRDRAGGRLEAVRAVLAATGPAPLMSEDALVPLLAGQRPVVLDAWMLRLAAERNPTLADPLVAALRDGAFGAVVLLEEVDAPGADVWFTQELGPAIASEVKEHWRLELRAAPYRLYRHATARTAKSRPPPSAE